MYTTSNTGYLQTRDDGVPNYSETANLMFDTSHSNVQHSSTIPSSEAGVTMIRICAACMTSCSGTDSQAVRGKRLVHPITFGLSVGDI